MKPKPITCCLTILSLTITLISSCSGNKATKNKPDTNQQTIASPVASKSADSIALTALVRNLYKWHETSKIQYDGFKPLKLNQTDTAYTSIDLDENKKAVSELKETGLFTDDFLNDYTKIAIRMDKELREGTSLWPEGELSTFGDDSDEWCNCQDFPVDKYWEIIKLKKLTIDNDKADFKWTWGDDFYYHVKAAKENGTWKISYLQGFDMKAYSWDWWKNNKN